MAAQFSVPRARAAVMVNVAYLLGGKDITAAEYNIISNIIEKRGVVEVQGHGSEPELMSFPDEDDDDKNDKNDSDLPKQPKGVDHTAPDPTNGSRDHSLELSRGTSAVASSPPAQQIGPPQKPASATAASQIQATRTKHLRPHERLTPISHEAQPNSSTLTPVVSSASLHDTTPVAKSSVTVIAATTPSTARAATAPVITSPRTEQDIRNEFRSKVMAAASESNGQNGKPAPVAPHFKEEAHKPKQLQIHQEPSLTVMAHIVPPGEPVSFPVWNENHRPGSRQLLQGQRQTHPGPPHVFDSPPASPSVRAGLRVMPELKQPPSSSAGAIFTADWGSTGTASRCSPFGPGRAEW